jgi:hypothetical protein
VRLLLRTHCACTCEAGTMRPAIREDKADEFMQRARRILSPAA